ncbi:hypothetical protein E4U15_005315 [Claviceps sp. LM218 group G6]|nr:hypothetical protein E4U15_005315 [Claviceps sp. LM218 group G6]
MASLTVSGRVWKRGAPREEENMYSYRLSGPSPEVDEPLGSAFSLQDFNCGGDRQAVARGPSRGSAKASLRLENQKVARCRNPSTHQLDMLPAE